MPDVLFGQSYYLRFDPKEWAAMMPYPPLGTLYAAAYIRARGYTVALFDSMLAAHEDEWAAALDAQQPRFAVIYEDSFNYLSKMCLTRMREAAFRMIPAAKARGCTVIISGSDATDHQEKYFAAGADAIVLGEGEKTLAELLDCLTGRQAGDPAAVLGVSTPAAPTHTKREFIRTLDELPFPAWDLVDLARYKAIWYAQHGYYSMNMVTTRGCPYHCNWCAKPIYGQRYNVRSPHSVAAEVKWLKDTFAPDHIWFADDIFGLKPNWVPQFADEIERLDARVPFKCLLRVDLIKDGVPEALRRAGCAIVWVGAESGSQPVLDAMDKGTQVEQIYAAAANLHRAGIRIGFFLQFGYPGERRADIEKTLQMVRDCRPDDIGISVSYPLPGTKFYDRVQAQLGAKRNWATSQDLDLMFQGAYSPEFYRTLYTVVHHEFRMHKARTRLTEIGPRFWRARPAHIRALAAIPRHWLGLQRQRAALNRLERESEVVSRQSSVVSR
ncbi:MAG TPA: radical SAM protein [Chloroflexia bacterium]|nr:radical SAM protein [Chloroflexia bacterium]